jgi:hypothetical protein
MKTIQSIFTLITLVFLSSCTDTNDVVDPGDKPIIQAYLAPGQPVSMTVFTEIPYAATSDSDSIQQPISGLSIRITDGNGKAFQLTDKGNGTYESGANDRIGTAGNVYTMEFGYKGRTVKGSTTIPAKPEGFTLSKTIVVRTKIDLSSGGFPGSGGGPFGGNTDDNTPIEVTWNNPYKENFFLAAVNVTPNPVAVFTLPPGRERPRLRFVNQPVTSSTSILNVQSFEYFGTYNVILYRVGVEYVALYQSSGTTTQNLSTPPSNISNGLGIFTGVNADTIALQILQK